MSWISISRRSPYPQLTMCVPPKTYLPIYLPTYLHTFLRHTYQGQSLLLLAVSEKRLLAKDNRHKLSVPVSPLLLSLLLHFPLSVPAFWITSRPQLHIVSSRIVTVQSIVTSGIIIT